MNILIIASEFGSESGGLSFACWKFTLLLKELGYNIFLNSSVEDCFLPDADTDLKIISSSIRIENGGYKKELYKHLFFKAHLSNSIEELKSKSIDLIVAFGAGENGFFASELSRMLGIPLMLLLRGSEINLSISDMALRQMNYIALKKSKVVIGLSKELIENSKEIYYHPKIKYEVIPNSINPPREIKITINQDKIVFGCGAHHVNEKKGIANLIAAIAELKKLIPKTIYLEVVGNIDDDLLVKYESQIISLGLEQQVYLLGSITRNEFIERMKSWDFYIQTSFGEGFCNSVAEYLSLGKGFILSNTGFIAEALNHNFHNIILDNLNPKRIAEKILKLIQIDDIQSYYNDAYNVIQSMTNEFKIKNKWKEVISNIKSTQFRPIDQNNILSIVFHDISLEGNSNIDVSLKALESFVEKVSKIGYSLCSSSDYFKSHDKSNLIVCTFDDGYENLHKYALPIFNKYNFTATIFVCYNYIGKTNVWNYKDTKCRMHLSESQLLELQENGWEIGSHGLSHYSLLKLTDKELLDELIISKNNLERLFGQIESYAYPYGDFNDYLKSKVMENYSVAYSLTKGGTLLGIDNYQIRRYFLSDFNSILDR